METLFWLAIACACIGVLCVLIILVCVLFALYMDLKGWRIYKDKEGNIVRRRVRRH